MSSRYWMGCHYVCQQQFNVNYAYSIGSICEFWAGIPLLFMWKLCGWQQPCLQPHRKWFRASTWVADCHYACTDWVRWPACRCQTSRQFKTIFALLFTLNEEPVFSHMIVFSTSITSNQFTYIWRALTYHNKHIQLTCPRHYQYCHGLMPLPEVSGALRRAA